MIILDGFVLIEGNLTLNGAKTLCRDYHAESERQKTVEEFYRQQHINQTYDFVSKISRNVIVWVELWTHSVFKSLICETLLIFVMQVKKMREEYSKLDKAVMSIWECCELLNEVVDDSDPDLDEPQIQHLLQSAEAIRKDYPDEDWLHLTALIHGILILHVSANICKETNCIWSLILTVESNIINKFYFFHGVSDLGKVLLLPKFGELPQWAVVGEYCRLAVKTCDCSGFFLSG